MPDISEFDVSVYPEGDLENTRKNYFNVFSWAIEQAGPFLAIETTSAGETDPFLVYGR